MKGRVSRFTAEQIKQIVDAVSEHGASEAPKHLNFKINSQLCLYYWRRANPEAPVKRRSKRRSAAEKLAQLSQEMGLDD